MLHIHIFIFMYIYILGSINETRVRHTDAMFD